MSSLAPSSSKPMEQSAMSPYMTVHHPNDPVLPDFDFWSWRVERRAVVNRLRALAQAESQAQNRSVASSLEEAADALEMEQFTRSHLRIIEGYVLQNWALLQSKSSSSQKEGEGNGVEFELPNIDDELIADMSFQVGKEELAEELDLEEATVSEVRELLDQIISYKGLGKLPIWDMPIMRPQWEKMRWMRPRFVGKINGVSVQVKLPDAPQEVVPDYKLVWLENNTDNTLTETGTLELMPSTPTGRRTNPVGRNLTYARPLWDWLIARRLTVLCLLGRGEWPDPEHPPMLLNGLSAPGRPL